MKRMKIVITILFLLTAYLYACNITLIPSQITLLKGEQYKLKTLYGIDVIETSSVALENENITKLNLNILGQTVKEVSVNVIENTEVIPIGKIIGLKLYTNGVLIVGMSEIEDVNHKKERPAK